MTRAAEAHAASDALDRRLDPESRGPIAVAFSGGADSLLTLLTAHAWATRHGRSVLALTVDHRLQAASAAWTRRCGDVAGRIGADFRALSWDGPKPLAGLPAAARLARHRLLAEAARAAGARVVLFGHTASDIAEGELMRAEGSNIGALREWTPAPVWPQGRELFCLRPLLELTRDAVRAHLAAEGWDWIDDPANDDARFGRPRARSALSNSAHSRASGDPGVFGAGRMVVPPLANIAHQGHLKSLGPRFRGDEGIEEANFGIGGAVTLARDITPQLLQISLLCVSGGEIPARTAKVDALAGRLAGPDLFTATLGGCRIVAGEREIVIVRDAGEVRRGNLAPLALVDGQVSVWDGRFELTAARPGLTVRPLQGVAARLAKPERARLCDLPAAARPALPAIVVNGLETVTCPILAERPEVRVTALAAGRWLSACGLIAHERAANRLAHGGFTFDVLSWARENGKRSK